MAIRRVLFSFQNNTKDLDPSYKLNLDLWDCLGRVDCLEKGKIGIIAKFHRTDLVICSDSREGKTLSYSQIDRVSVWIHCLAFHFKRNNICDTFCFPGGYDHSEKEYLPKERICSQRGKFLSMLAVGGNVSCSKILKFLR